MKKRFMSILLVLAMLFGICPSLSGSILTAYALEDTQAKMQAVDTTFRILGDSKLYKPSDFRGSVSIFIYGTVTCPFTDSVINMCNKLAEETSDDVKYFFISSDSEELVRKAGHIEKYPNVKICINDYKGYSGIGTHASKLKAFTKEGLILTPLFFILDREGNYYKYSTGANATSKGIIEEALEEMNDNRLFKKSEFTVTFVDYDNSIIEKITVPKGKAATPPANPNREGYVFNGWDKDLSRVISDMTVKAMYSTKADSSIDVSKGSLTVESVVAMAKKFPHSAFNSSKTTSYAVSPSFTAPYSAGSLVSSEISDALNTLKMICFLGGVSYENVNFTKELNELSQHGAVLLAAFGQFTHTPTKPADMDTAFFDKGYNGSNQANISLGYTNISSAILGLVADGGDNNIGEAGHRRWILKPNGKNFGIGYAQYNNRANTNMHVFDGGVGTPETYVAWPNSGDFPIQYFIASDNISKVPSYPWSINLGSEYKVPDRSSIQLTLTRTRDNKTWTFNNSTPELGIGNMPDNSMHLSVSNANKGMGKAIIFRPDLKSLGTIRDGDVFEVRLSGINKSNGQATTLGYRIRFFDLEKAMKESNLGDDNIKESDYSGDKTLATGKTHTVAIKNDGSLWAWGRNSVGIGTGTSAGNLIPVRIGKDNNWKSVAAGGSHTVAIKNDGSLWAWGSNESGQLGDGTRTNRLVPTRIGKDNDWKSVAAGDKHTVAIKKDGSLWAWGENENGQLGDGTRTDKTVPTRIGSDKWKSIATGDKHTIAIKSDGTLWGWGYNGFYSLGLGKGSGEDKKTPTLISSDNNWKVVEAGYNNSLAIKENGSLWGWGNNLNGSVGNGLYPIEKPKQIGKDTNWVSVATGYWHSLGVKADGTLWTWGSNGFGQLGDNGVKKYTTVPIQVGSEKKWKSVAAGTWHATASKTNDTIWAWGDNRNAQIGDGTKEQRNVPVQLKLLDSNTATEVYNQKLSQYSVTFKSATVGYGKQTPQTITLTNTGNVATKGSKIILSGKNASSFTVTPTYISSIPVGGSKTFTIVPKTGLAVGKYTAKVTVDSNGVSSRITVSFEVTSNSANTGTSTIKINKQPAASTTVTQGSISGSLTVNASVTKGKTLSYQWCSSKTGNNPPVGTKIQGATNVNFTIPKDLKAGTYYYFCIVSAEGAEPIRTNIAKVVVKAPSSYKAGLNILQYPTKTAYKVGEGFDSTGLNVVNYANGKATNVNNKITFYVSKINGVQLTQGRKFTTTGTNVVELRYEGKKVGTYTINVTK